MCTENGQTCMNVCSHALKDVRPEVASSSLLIELIFIYLADSSFLHSPFLSVGLLLHPFSRVLATLR